MRNPIAFAMVWLCLSVGMAHALSRNVTADDFTKRTLGEQAMYVAAVRDVWELEANGRQVKGEEVPAGIISFLACTKGVTLREQVAKVLLWIRENAVNPALRDVPAALVVMLALQDCRR